MLDEEMRSDFINDYKLFAKAVLARKKEHMKDFSGGILSRGIFSAGWLPDGEGLSTDPQIVGLAKKVFSYNLIGLTSLYERGFGDNPLGWYLINNERKLDFDHSPSSAIERLLYPLLQLTHHWKNIDINIDDDLSSSIIKMFTNSWNMDAWFYKIIIPLHNLSSNIDDDIIFGKFTLSKSYKHTDIPPHILENCELLLLQDNFVDPEDFDSFKRELERIVTFIRLVIPEQPQYFNDIGLSKLYFIPWLPRREGAILTRDAEYTLRSKKMMNMPGWDKSQLTMSLADQIKLLLGDEDNYLDKLEFSFQRFNKSYGRESDEDKIIDLIISLESCLLPDKVQELSYKLSLRLAKLLSCDEPPKRTYEMIRTAYEIRSRILHNGETFKEHKNKKKNKKPIKLTRRKYEDVFGVDFVHAFREISRKTIMKLIDINYQRCNDFKVDEINDDWLSNVATKIDEQIIASFDVSR